MRLIHLTGGSWVPICYQSGAARPPPNSEQFSWSGEAPIPGLAMVTGGETQPQELQSSWGEVPQMRTAESCSTSLLLSCLRHLDVKGPVAGRLWKVPMAGRSGRGPRIREGSLGVQGGAGIKAQG